ncbi:hypothetical protein MMC25_007811 [Agyrium rufum]|nr:hypothetical protein [Agyrium rufum]
MSWFWRGFQSAVFYYVSCAPCTKLNAQRKRKLQTRRARAEKRYAQFGQHADKNDDSHDHHYPHPSPYSTNIFWHEEMVLGPGPPTRRKGNRGGGSSGVDGSSRDLISAGVESSAGASSADTTLVVESLEGDEAEQEDTGHDRWNRKRYQRPDEHLWGIEMVEPAIATPGGTLSKATTTTSDGSSYYVARNPAVNDLHPPVVSTYPQNQKDTRWMLQPPPSAKIMEGKEKLRRERSYSGGSSRRGVESLRKQGAENILAVKMAAMGGNIEDVRREAERQDAAKVDTTATEKGMPSNETSTLISQSHDRYQPRQSSESMTSSSASLSRSPTAGSVSNTPSRTKKRPTPLNISPSPSTRLPRKANADPSRPRSLRSNTASAAQIQPSRPQLLSIASSSSAISRIHKGAANTGSEVNATPKNLVSSNSLRGKSRPITPIAYGSNQQPIPTNENPFPPLSPSKRKVYKSQRPQVQHTLSSSSLRLVQSSSAYGGKTSDPISSKPQIPLQGDEEAESSATLALPEIESMFPGRQDREDGKLGTNFSFGGATQDAAYLDRSTFPRSDQGRFDGAWKRDLQQRWSMDV